MKKRNFTTFPILITERLTLRQLSIDDQTDILALRSDDQINKYLGRKPSKTIEDAINFINTVNYNIEQNNALYWAITLTNSKTVVGTICLFNFSIENNSCEIGYELMTKFQSQGLMTEAIQKVIKYVYQVVKIKKIIAYTHCDNQNSTKLLEKFNFVKSTEIYKENPDLNIYILTQ